MILEAMKGCVDETTWVAVDRVYKEQKNADAELMEADFELNACNNLFV